MTRSPIVLGLILALVPAAPALAAHEHRGSVVFVWSGHHGGLNLRLGTRGVQALHGQQVFPRHALPGRFGGHRLHHPHPGRLGSPHIARPRHGVMHRFHRHAWPAHRGMGHRGHRHPRW